MSGLVFTVVAVYMTSAMVNLIGLAELKDSQVIDEEEIRN